MRRRERGGKQGRKGGGHCGRGGRVCEARGGRRGRVMKRHPGKSPAARMYGLKYVFFTSFSARSYAVNLARS